MTLINNCRIYPISAPAIEDGYVLVENGKIKEIGAGNGNPEGCDIVIEGNGGYLLPGLVDAHTHLGLFNEGLRIEGEDGNEDTDPVTPHMRAVDGINPQDIAFREALMAGVTTVMTGPGSANPISGIFAVVKTCGVCVDDMALIPCAAMKLALGENPKMTYGGKERSPATRMATAAVIRETLYKAREYMEKREDPDEEMEFDIKYEALVPVLEGRMPVHIHCHRADDIFTAVRIAKEFSLKYALVHCTDGHMIAERLGETGAPIIVGPMMNTRSKPELMGLNSGTAAALHRAGSPVAICTDHPETPQSMLMLSAALAAREGMSDEDAFRAITLVPAQIIGVAERVGSLEVGKDADMVLYDGHPFDTRTRVAQVMINGECVM